MGGEADYSIRTGQIRTFGVVDFVLFSLVLAVSALIGLYYAYKDRKQISTKNFMLGDKSMSIFPVAMSLTVTFLSALTLLGNPTEVYNYNTMFWWLALAMLVAVAASSCIYAPFFYRLRVTTVFEYLQMRFNTSVRILASVLFILQTLVYFSFILYAPSLALSAVTSLSLWGSVVGMGLLVTFYTTLGGMKAVLWTDTFQAVIILVGLLAVLTQGSIVAGGFAQAWRKADERGRIKFDDFSFDPSVRHSFWSVVVGGSFFWSSLYGVNQAQVQRCIACPSVKQAQLALWLNLPGIIIISSLCFMIGVVMFAFYADCHPAGIISNNDQLLPLFVMDILSDFPGIPGVFVACIFSGSLSSLSSGLNAISCVTIKDLLVPYCFPKISDFKTTIITKVIVVVYGGMGMGLAYVVGQLGDVLQASYSAYAVLNGPVFGVFLLGMFFPWANSAGAIVGCVTSLVFMCWIGTGAFWHKVSTSTRSALVTTGCQWTNATTAFLNTTPATAYTTTITTLSFSNTTLPLSPPAADPNSIPAYPLYTLSYLYYTVTGAVVVIVVGLIVSLISGANKPRSMDPRLICPLLDVIFPCLPECVLKPFRFGIDHKDKYERHKKATKESAVEAKMAYDTKVSGSGRAPSQPRSPSWCPISPVSVPYVKERDNIGFDNKGLSSSGDFVSDTFAEYNTKL